MKTASANSKKLAEAFVLEGEWTVQHAPALEKSIIDWKQHASGRAYQVNPEFLEKLDTAGARLIQKYFSDARFTKPFKPQQQALLNFVSSIAVQKSAKNGLHKNKGFFYSIGEKTMFSIGFIYELMAFIGIVFTRFGKNILSPAHFRLPSIVRHIEETGLRALPIICLMAFGISAVIFYQGATQLQKLGADIYTIDLTVISLLREMALLMTAIMVAGRSGSAFAAEIGVMKLRGEVDSLKTMGIDPVEALVVPRLLALLITLPLLSFIADIVGLAGGGLMSHFMLGLSAAQYIDRVQQVATPAMFFIGMIKAPVMAFVITIICTYQGMNASGSAENVGKLTTLAVVQSIFMVIMADALFSIVFSKMGM